MARCSNPPGTPSRSRLPWLDFARGLAVLAMVEAHVVNTFLAAPLLQTRTFHAVDYLNGLVAPAFLFIAGYAYSLGLRTMGARSPWPKARRLAAVALLGYVLHIPVPQLIAGQWTEAVAIWWRVDILQCLAASLGIILVVETWMPRVLPVVVVGLAVAAVASSSAAATWSFPPGWLLAFFSPRTGSLFPLLPWFAFVAAGLLAGRMRARWEAADPHDFAASRVFAILAAGALPAAFLPAPAGFFFERLGWMLLTLCACVVVASRVAPAFLLFIGRESLAIYAAHLVLIEILALTVLPRNAHAPWLLVPLFLGVATASGGIAWLWRRAAAKP